MKITKQKSKYSSLSDDEVADETLRDMMGWHYTRELRDEFKLRFPRLEDNKKINPYLHQETPCFSMPE